MTLLSRERNARWDADNWIAAAATVVVIAVSAFAAIVSYTHIYDLALKYGQSGLAARLLPLSIDGVILATSLIMLHESRKGRDIPRGVRASLWGAVAATLVANAASGEAYHAPGMILAVASGAAFVVTVEVLIFFVRRLRENAKPQASTDSPQAAADNIEAAQNAIEATWRAGNVLSQRQVIARFRLSRDEEIKLRGAVLAKLEPREPEKADLNGDASVAHADA